MQDNTSVAQDQDASAMQNTVEDQSVKEPVRKGETSQEGEKAELKKKEFNFLGKYSSEEEAHKAFAAVQERARKAEEQLKEMKTEMSAREIQEFNKMDYEQQMNFLLKRNKEQEEALSQVLSVISTQAQQSDEQGIGKFIQSQPLLSETGLENEFKLLATHPDLKEYTLDSIFNTLLKPKIEKIMGTKIRIKEKRISTDTETAQQDFADVSKMPMDEYEKHRVEILKSL